MSITSTRWTHPSGSTLRTAACRCGASLHAAGAAVVLALLTLLIVLAAPANAQTSRSASIDPPGRAARLAATEGQVWLYHPDQGEWVSAGVNRPLTSGDRLATDRGARAEIEIGSTTLRIDASTEIDLQVVDDDQLTARLLTGSVIARVLDVRHAGRVEITTDAGRFVVQRSGLYRVDHADGTSHATVYQGQLRYEGPNSGLAVDAGQRAEFWIDAAGAAQYALSAPLSDAFVSWSSARDRRPASNTWSRYASPEMTGVDDLDRYGRWEQNPEHGALWIPANVGPNWAPYSQGHWTWVAPWGWTWIDDAPWGFAPFHYGRWVYVRSNWCWTPGVRVARPVYAPALVAWVGGSRGGSGREVGWFPLAPREVYVPSYRVSPRYARDINITHVGNAGQIDRVINNPLVPRQFENRRFPQALTVVPANVLTERRPVAPASADYRRSASGRDFAQQPGRSNVIVAPQASPPPLAARGEGRSNNIAPAPGFGDRGGFGRPVQSPRDRDRDRNDDDVRRDAARAAQRSDGVANDRPVPPGTSISPTVPVRPQTAPPAAAGGGVSPIPPRPAARAAPPSVQPAPQAPAQVQQAPAQIQQVPAQAQQAPQAAPEMRALPMRPGENRRDLQRPNDERRGDDRRGDERRSQPARAEPPAGAQPAPPGWGQRAPMAPGAAPAPAVTMPAAPPPAAARARPPEVPRVAPPQPVAPPEVQRAQTPERAEPSPRSAESRRGEPLAPREQQR